MIENKGFIRVFLSSAYSKLISFRISIIDELDSVLESVAMEKFIPTSETSQQIALKELDRSDIIIFLVSPYYGSEIEKCDIADDCKADCEMKSNNGNISYTWCEYRYSKANEKPHISYVINEGWDKEKTQKENSNTMSKVLKFREEVENEYCPRIKNDEKSIQRIRKDLTNNIINWYEKKQVTIQDFCSRQYEIKKLVSKILNGGTIAITGIGGIGKSTLCDIVLLLLKLYGKDIIYIKKFELYSSGSGYKLAHKKFEDSFINANMKTSEQVLDSILNKLDVYHLDGYNINKKIDLILEKINLGKILYIDNFQSDEILEKLIRKGNGLVSGTILYSTKTDSRLTGNKIRLKPIIEEDRADFIHITAKKMGLILEREIIEKISELSEGHPIAIYLLLSNLERIDVLEIEELKDGINFSDNEDIEEYIRRIIRSSLNSSEAFELLKYIALIGMDFDYNYKINFTTLTIAYKNIYNNESIIPLFSKIVDSFIMKRSEGKILWNLNQLRDFVFEDKPNNHRLAVEYYKILEREKDDFENLLRKTYHFGKMGYIEEVYDIFIQIADSDLFFRCSYTEQIYLMKIGDLLIENFDGYRKGILLGKMGYICGMIGSYRNKIFNREKAIDYLSKALENIPVSKYPYEYAQELNNLASSYRDLSFNSNTRENLMKAHTKFIEVLTIFTKDRYPSEYARVLINFGNVFTNLAKIENKKRNCEKAHSLLKESLTLIDKNTEPFEYAGLQHNLGLNFYIYSEVDKFDENIENAMKSYEEALVYFDKLNLQDYFASVLNDIGILNIYLADRDSKFIEIALETYKRVLEIWPEETHPENYANIHLNLGTIYEKKAEKERNPEYFLEALRMYEKARYIIKKEDFSINYCKLQIKIGDTYFKLMIVSDKYDYCDNVFTAYKEAMDISIKEKHNELTEIIEKRMLEAQQYCKPK